MKVFLPHHLLPPPKFKIQMFFCGQIDGKVLWPGIPEDSLALRICGSVLAAMSSAAVKEFYGGFYLQAEYWECSH